MQALMLFSCVISLIASWIAWYIKLEETHQGAA